MEEHKQHSPTRNLPLRNRIISHTLNTDLLAASTTGQSLITSILPQPTAITRAHIPETRTTLSSLPSSPRPSTNCRSCNIFHAPRTPLLRRTMPRALAGRRRSVSRRRTRGRARIRIHRRAMDKLEAFMESVEGCPMRPSNRTLRICIDRKCPSQLPAILGLRKYSSFDWLNRYLDSEFPA